MGMHYNMAAYFKIYALEKKFEDTDTSVEAAKYEVVENDRDTTVLQNVSKDLFRMKVL